MVGLPPELHQHEQYYFLPETRDWVADVLAPYGNPCLLGLPSVARRLPGVRLLDIDERFEDHDGFQKWDMYRPKELDEVFDIIVCDPPFKTVSFSQLFDAIRTLAQGDYDHEILVTGLARREQDLLATFHPFGLRPTGVQARYISVQAQEGHSQIMWYSNFDLD